MLTAGIDLAAQPAKTGAVLVEWATQPPSVIDARIRVDDAHIVDVCRRVNETGGKVGIDCALGWPREFVKFVVAHAADDVLPPAEPTTQSLRLRATDVALSSGWLHMFPLSVSTNLLGVTAFRAARVLTQLRENDMHVDRSGTSGVVCEVYPAASRKVWGLAGKPRELNQILAKLPMTVSAADRATLENEHAFDALVAALSARAVTLNQTRGPGPGEHHRASEEGWIHVPNEGHQLADLTKSVGLAH
jgi:predicted nuclease with RNAse H fold